MVSSSLWSQQSWQRGPVPGYLLLEYEARALPENKFVREREGPLQPGRHRYQHKTIGPDREDKLRGLVNPFSWHVY